LPDEQPITDAIEGASTRRTAYHTNTPLGPSHAEPLPRRAVLATLGSGTTLVMKPYAAAVDAEAFNRSRAGGPDLVLQPALHGRLQRKSLRKAPPSSYLTGSVSHESPHQHGVAAPRAGSPGLRPPGLR
jgi:hypothetical protein